jgi:hypothetical protein
MAFRTGRGLGLTGKAGPGRPTVLVRTLWERRVRRDQPAALPEPRSLIALHAALLQQPAPSVRAGTLWERHARRDRPFAVPQHPLPTEQVSGSAPVATFVGTRHRGSP